ncbi:MAG: hypothetical protein P4L16_03215 [Chlamydiales bacterium]|nr:hypothetical protein [Chlamydiales bacterium]
MDITLGSKHWDEKTIENKLDELAHFDKNESWLSADLTVHKKGFFTKLFWRICKLFYSSNDLKEASYKLETFSWAVLASKNPALSQKYRDCIAKINTLSPQRCRVNPSKNIEQPASTKVLVLDPSVVLSPEEFGNLLDKHPNLTCLYSSRSIYNIHGCNWASGTGCDWLTDEHLKKLQNQNNLKDICLYKCPNITDAGITDLKDLPLTSLRIICCQGFDGSHLNSLPPTLTQLDLRGNTIDEWALKHCKNTNLQTLLLDKTNVYSLRNLPKEIQASLTTLSLSNCSNIDASSFGNNNAVQRATFPNLTTLYLSGCRNIHDFDFLKRSPKLQGLDLSCCSQIERPININSIQELTELLWIDLRRTNIRYQDDIMNLTINRKITIAWPHCVLQEPSEPEDAPRFSVIPIPKNEHDYEIGSHVYYLAEEDLDTKQLERTRMVNGQSSYDTPANYWLGKWDSIDKEDAMYSILSETRYII